MAHLFGFSFDYLSCRTRIKEKLKSARVQCEKEKEEEKKTNLFGVEREIHNFYCDGKRAKTNQMIIKRKEYRKLKEQNWQQQQSGEKNKKTKNEQQTEHTKQAKMYP